MELVFARGRNETGMWKYPTVDFAFPVHLSPWEACGNYMDRGYLPPFELVRQLHEEEVEYGDVARRLWVLRGARRTARLVQEAGVFALRQVHTLKKQVQGWR